MKNKIKKEKDKPKKKQIKEIKKNQKTAIQRLLNLSKKDKKAEISKEVKKEDSLKEKEFEKKELEEKKSPEEELKGVSLIQEKEIKLKEGDKNSKVIEKYNIEVDGAKVDVSIKRKGLDIEYILSMPEIDIATKNLLNQIRNELISITAVSMKELTNPLAFNSIKERFLQEAKLLIKRKLPNIQPEIEKYLIGKLIQDMLGLGDIEFLINDPSLEEIVIPSAREPIRVYSKSYGWIKTNLQIEQEEEIINYSNIIARRIGKQITLLEPLLDAHLVSGDRINAVLYPINTKGNTITIRKFARDPFTMVDFIKNKTCSFDAAALVWLAMEFEMNILISGGTGSGKTSFLNACLPFIPPNQRIITIEDTRELILPEFLYWTPLVTRSANPEGKGQVTMLDLLINSLRMRPDRIILGEMRKKEEASVLFEAMHTGHSVYATVHADSAPETVSRLINPPLSVPPNLLRSVSLNVVLFRDRRKGIRRILQIAEFEAEADKASANILYRLSHEKDEIVKHNESSRFVETLLRNTGMSEKEIDKNLEEKKNVLKMLVKHNIRDLSSFGKIISNYYKNKEKVMEAVKKDNPKLIFTD